MGKLDLLITDFASIESGMESLLVTLKALEEFYDLGERNELNAFLDVTIRNLDSLRKDMGECIIKLDDYRMEEKKV